MKGIIYITEKQWDELQNNYANIDSHWLRCFLAQIHAQEGITEFSLEFIKDFKK